MQSHLPRRILPRLVLVLVALVLGAPRSADAVDKWAVTRDLVYTSNGNRQLHLDLYYPAVEPAENYPVVVFTHGGGWAAGSKDKARQGKIGDVTRGLLNNGFCVAAVQYRLAKNGQSTIRDCVTDCIDAVRYLAKHGRTLHVDADRVLTFGDSAGGHLAQMLLLANPENFPGDVDLNGTAYTIRAGVSWYGPCDFEDMSLFNHDDRPNFKDRFAGRILGKDSHSADRLDRYREVSPVRYLTRKSPPLLMIQGDSDTTIPVKHAYAMEKRASSLGALVEVMVVRHAGHNWRKADGITPIEPAAEVVVQRTIDFLTSHRDAR